MSMDIFDHAIAVVGTYRDPTKGVKECIERFIEELDRSEHWEDTWTGWGARPEAERLEAYKEACQKMRNQLQSVLANT